MARQQSKSILLYSGVTAQTITQQEATNISSDVWFTGDLVHIDATGKSTIATGVYILGIATATCSGVDNADFDVELLDYNALYTVTAPAATATARSSLGHTIDITYTAGAHVIATSETNAVIHLVGIYEGNDDTTAGGRYIFKFNPIVILPGVST